jgi:hypothetical protein
VNEAIVVRADIDKKHGAVIEYTFSPFSSFRFLKMFLVDATRHKCRIHQFDVAGAFLQEKTGIRVFIKRPKLHGIISPEYQTYHDRPV